MIWVGLVQMVLKLSFLFLCIHGVSTKDPHGCFFDRSKSYHLHLFYMLLYPKNTTTSVGFSNFSAKSRKGHFYNVLLDVLTKLE